MKPQLLLISILITVFSAAVGFFIFSRPALAIEIQRRFYEKINWRIEPISMQKEIRNTKFMGMFLIVVTIFTIIYVLVLGGNF